MHNIRRHEKNKHDSHHANDENKVENDVTSEHRRKADNTSTDIAIKGNHIKMPVSATSHIEEEVDSKI